MSEPAPSRSIPRSIWQEAVRRVAPPPLWAWLLDTELTAGELIEVLVPDDVAVALAERKRVLERLTAYLGERLGWPPRIILRRVDDPTFASASLPPPAPPLVAAQEDVLLFRHGQPVEGRGEPIARLELGTVVFSGVVFREERRPMKNGGKLLLLDITDHQDAIRVKYFLRTAQEPPPLLGAEARVRGDLQYDRVERREVVVASGLELRRRPKEDPGPPRFEIHLHTTMSALDGLIRPEALAREARRFGLAGVVITDHGVVQAFPEAWQAFRTAGLKLRYGIEAYVVDEEPLVYGTWPDTFDEFIALDFETTSLTPLTGEVIEIGAVLFRGGSVADRFGTLVRPEGPVPPRVLELTEIPWDALQSAPRLEEVLPEFASFLGWRPLVAHNASFDRGFLRKLFRRLGKRLEQPVVDTLALGRRLLPHLKSHRLPDLAAEAGIRQVEHHRAVEDALVCGQIFARWLERRDIETLAAAPGTAVGRPFHVLGVVKEPAGLRTLYQLVSRSHLEHFYRVPRLHRRDLSRQGLFWGAPACFDGELVTAVLRGDEPEELAALARRYDFVEIPLPSRLLASADEGLALTEGEARQIVQALREAAERAGVLPVFGSDAHHLEPEEAVLRRIAARAQGVTAAPPLPLPTSRQAIEELSQLFPDAEALVTEHGRRLLEEIPDFPPVPDGLHAPEIPEAAERVRTDAEARARALYGDPLPNQVAERLNRELDAILSHGYAVVYHVARLLVEASLADGYAVGSRGSVGSSLVAFLLGITEVNPLPPHYLCPGCYVEFRDDVEDGFDLPSRPCPRCGRPLKGDGHDIPFETFLGFEGDKVPDIDLNFSGEEQPRIHRKAEEIFGRDRVFRAGTIATVAERTAYGLVKGYLEEEGRQVREWEVERLAEGLIGCKRTTGQHPGGVMIVPKTKDVHDFTPLQYPADDASQDTVTTHFDYSAISSRLLKLDLLGHDDPTVLRLLADMTGVDPRTVPLDDPKTLSLFSSVEALGIPPEYAGGSVGTLGIPEFGTRFVRGMLEATRPTSFGELIRISGLSHGTDVWTNNARDLIRDGVATLKEVIATRDDIMLYLVAKGLPKKQAFKIMEDVRKGKGLQEADREAMRAHGVPEWYIRSCDKILYMFPKAHAAAYVTMAVRIAYFKVHHPLAFYASYFSVRAEEFDLDHAYLSDAQLKQALVALERKGREASARERALATHLEVVREMQARGIRFLPLSLRESLADRYWPKDGGLLPPFAAVPGLGRIAAQQLVQARQDGMFRSLADLRARVRLPRPAVEALGRFGALTDLPADDQITLFS